MDERKTRQELLDDLVSKGTLSQQQAEDIEYAPVWSFSLRELLSYLASIIIAVGVVRILAVAFEDASEAAISASLYALSVATGFASWKLSTGSVIRRRFAEVLELGSLGSFIGATAIVLVQLEVDDPFVGMVCSSLGVVWGLYRCRAATFAGTVALVAGIPALSGSIGAWTDTDNTWAISAFVVVPAVILLFAGTQKIGVPLLARAVGSLLYLNGVLPLGAELSYGKPIPIVLGAALFAVGSILFAPEMLLAGAILIVAGVVMSVVHWVSNDIAQGLVIIATGLAMLGVLAVQMKRAVNRPKIGIPTA